LTPVPFGGALVRGVRRPVKPYAPHVPGRGLMLGFDTETLQRDGRATLYTAQLASAKGATLRECRTASDAWRYIIDTVHALGHRETDGPVVLWAYNLNFDLLWLLGREHWRVLAGGSYNGKQKQIKIEGGDVIGLKSFVYGRVAFAEVHHRGYKFLLRDLRLWWAGGLGELAPLLGSAKLTAPRGLGRTPFLLGSPRVRQAFEAYARRDAVLALRAGNIVRSVLSRLGVWSFAHVPVSAAHAAALVYRAGLEAPIPPARTFPELRAALHAFAGGRAGTLIRGRYPLPVTSYDVNSMYPWAMLALPEPAAWDVRPVKGWSGEDAIYLVNGECTDRQWPGLVERDREGRMWALVGSIRGAWCTGYELESFRRWGDGQLDIVRGFAYRATRAQVSFPRFVGALYPLRSDRDPAVRSLAKTILNALSGKFIEHHSRFALPRGLRFKIAAPPGIARGYGARSGQTVTSPQGVEYPVSDEWIDRAEVAEYDAYITRAIDALIDGRIEEIGAESAKHFNEDGYSETVNLEYVTQDAGGTFAPEVSTLILGKARARLHDLMHEHHALYWDTDSIMVPSSHKMHRGEIGAAVGKLKIEGEGLLHVSRAKLYYLADKGNDTDLVKIAAAGIPAAVPDSQKMALVDGTPITFVELQGVTPGNTRLRNMADVGTFETVEREARDSDDPRVDYMPTEEGYEWCDPRPMPWSVRTAGRLKQIADEAE
jgi:DNA polymerase type B, organellar and viral